MKLQPDVIALIDPHERHHARSALAEHADSTEMAATVRRLVVAPLWDWIEAEYQRAGGHTTSTEAGIEFARKAEDLAERFENAPVVPECLESFDAAWTAWLEAMAQGGAAIQAKATEKRSEGADKTNQRYDVARDAAREIAEQLVQGDTDRELRKEDMLALIGGELQRRELHRPNDRNLWQWLKAEPSTIPSYMSRAGRPRRA